MKADDFGTSDARLVSKATGVYEDDHYWMLSTFANGSVRFRLKTGGSTTTLISGSGVITAGEWHHVSATYDGQRMRLYRDGEQVGSVAKTGSIDTNPNVPMAIANQPQGNRAFDGLIDEVRLYNRALTDAEIQTDMAAPVADQTDPTDPADTELPAISLDSIPASATYTSAQTVSIDANASANEGVARVEFYKDSELVETDEAAPYSCPWSISSADNGTHSWTAKAYDNAGNVGTSDAISLTVQIVPLAADFKADRTVVATNSPVSFNGSDSADITAWSWDFGDGGTGGGPTPVHTYTSEGTFTVSLTVEGPDGSATAIKTGYITAIAPPVAGFQTGVTSGADPLTRAFSDRSTGEIDSRQWDFGDDGSSTEASPVYTYSAPGTYAVKLTVTGPVGSDTMTKVVHVEILAEQALIEVGEITLDHGWIRVDFENEFIDPVVVVNSLSSNDDEPALVRVDAVDADGFSVRVQEWDYLPDPAHAPETAGYLVVERGRHELSNGAWIEAGSLEVDHRFVVAEFETPFASPPVVLTTVTTNYEEQAVTTRVKHVNESEFKIKLQEQEAFAKDPTQKDHTHETVDYVAWEPSVGEVEGIAYEVGRTDDKVSHSFHTIDFSTTYHEPPVVLTGMQTTDGGDSASLRWSNKRSASVDVRVKEEQSRDIEVRQKTEVVGYVILGNTDAVQP